MSDPLQGLWMQLGFRPVFLWSDILIYMLLVGGGLWLWLALRQEYWRVALRQVLTNRMAVLSFGILCMYAAIGLLDTIHFKTVSPSNPSGGSIQSVLDVLCQPLIERTEKTYSAPFATHLFSKESVLTPDGRTVQAYPRLKYAGRHLDDLTAKASDIGARLLDGLVLGLAAGVFFFVLFTVPLFLARWRLGPSDRERLKRWTRSSLCVVGFFTVTSILIAQTVVLSEGYHVLGTDKAGHDVFYTGLKSIRTGLVIGILTTLIVTPFAILFGVLAGYFRGWVDDAIQYVYTTLSSIPDILLIAAAMLIFQVGLAAQETIVSADERLVYLCLIMGITSWTGLCRLIRAETLKLREIEYVQAADAFGVSRRRIMLRHLVPGVMHIVLISIVLRFSGLVLAEAVLAYVGIGVDPSMQSWGNMINQARFELAREPVVWWNLLAAFVFMLGLVLPANLFGDAVRDALDPRLRTQ